MARRVPALLTPACLTMLIGTVLATPAGAATWQLIESRGRAQTELDTSSVVRKDGRATGWVQHTYSKLTSSESGAYFAYRSMKEHLRMQCGERTVTVLGRAYFNDEGTEIAMIKGTSETRAVAPDSVEQRVLARMCNPQAAPDTAQAPRPAAVALPKTDIKIEAARIDASKRIAGAPVAPTAPTAPIAPITAIPVSAMPIGAEAALQPGRYMDGPANATARSNFLKTKADAGAQSPPADTPLADKAAGQALAKPVAAALAPAATVAHVAHGASAAPAQPKTPAAHESRKQVVARVLRERGPGATRTAPATPDDHRHASAEHVHWAYDGEFAPYRWGDMKADYATCKSGTRQSPIDIRNPVVSDVEPIQFHYEDTPLKVSNNGHTIEVEYAPGSFILHGGARYELLQFHFHTPSEERINGRAFDMVVHLVHKSAQGKMAVVAVLLSAGKEQAMLQQVWNAMPGTPHRSRERLDVVINAKSLLPADPAFYSFVGSLTTPPCTEGVQWLVMKTPVDVSREQIGHFAALYPMNARPLQAHNDRLIKAGR